MLFPKVEGYAAGVLESVDDARRQTTADDLTRLSQSIEANADLRGALTDTAMPPAVRAAVLGDLLAGRVIDTAATLAVYAARTAHAQDLPPALADLAHYAHIRVRPEAHEPQGLSLLASRRRVSGFADAVLVNVSVEQFGQIEDDLFRWARIIESNAELRRVLTDRDVSIAGRSLLVTNLLSGRVAATSLRLALYVIEGGRPRDVVGTVDFLVDYIAQARNWRVGRVWSARELAPADRDALRASLRQITGHEVELQVTFDPSLLGGVLVQVGDLRLDATTKGRLMQLREGLADTLGHHQLLDLNS